MSRRSHQLPRDSQERWPDLYQFLASYLHQDWPVISGTPDAAIEQAIADWNLDGRQRVLKQWRDWMDTLGHRLDIATSVNALGVNIHFKSDLEARDFMNRVYDKVILSVRNETGNRWKP